MAREKLSEQEWETFLGLADRLGIDLRTLLKEDVRFHELESAGHALGRAVAQATTERLAFTRAERLTGPQPCPTCGRACPLVHRDRRLETIDGPHRGMRTVVRAGEAATFGRTERANYAFARDAAEIRIDLQRLKSGAPSRTNWNRCGCAPRCV